MLILEDFRHLEAFASDLFIYISVFFLALYIKTLPCTRVQLWAETAFYIFYGHSLHLQTS